LASAQSDKKPDEGLFQFGDPEDQVKPKSLFVEATGGVRFRSIGSSDVEPVFGAALFWSPRQLDGRYGVVVGARGAPPVDIDTDELDGGSYTDIAAFAGLGVRLPLRGRVSVAWSLAADVHFTKLEGRVVSLDRDASGSGVELAARGHLGAHVDLGRVDVEIGGDAERWFGDRGYTLMDVSVLDTPETVYSIVLSISVGVW
jgi:hypothetical protein